MLDCKTVKNKEMKTLKEIREYAFGCHDAVNQTYAAYPYSYHLKMVAAIAKEHIELVSENKRDIVIAACYCHDLIEDARQTYNDVKTSTGSVEVAEIVRACTNYTRGRNRAERMPDYIYNEIRNNPNALFVKLCDRIANVLHSKETASTMLNAYRKEHAHFKNRLFTGDYLQLWAILDNTLQIETTNS